IRCGASRRSGVHHIARLRTAAGGGTIMSTATADHTRDGHERSADRVGSPWVGAIAFEWTKLVSVRSTWWIVAVSVFATLFGSGLLGASALASGRNGLDSAAPAPYFVVQ